ncbi:unnamed protein product [Cladocopium goreaui]|uniref:C3H1-type domain-containing protein n=1 Tax=Cladocopium goreaui TaxID=2562237 RepID=A0A9P1C3J1_9DINO|nr:unnamed protein product [Cladocopium goreaui]
MDESKVRDAQNPAEKMPEQDKESASTSFETHSPSAISSGWDESSRGQGKLRGLPSLNRGYRTPDPSPSHLPKCGALELMIGAEDGLSDAPGSPRNYGTPRRRIETGPWNMEEEREVPASPGLSRIRTPSPLLDRSCVASVPPPPALLCAPGYSVGAMWPVLTVNTCPWSGVEWVAAIPPELAPSRGSIGHPYSCNAACKYSGKERGCKDGRNCDHCHLCQWRRTPGPLPSTGMHVAPGRSHKLPSCMAKSSQRTNYKREGSRPERAAVATLNEIPRRNRR